MYHFAIKSEVFEIIATYPPLIFLFASGVAPLSVPCALAMLFVGVMIGWISFPHPIPLISFLLLNSPPEFLVCMCVWRVSVCTPYVSLAIILSPSSTIQVLNQETFKWFRRPLWSVIPINLSPFLYLLNWQEEVNGNSVFLLSFFHPPPLPPSLLRGSQFRTSDFSRHQGN